MKKLITMIGMATVLCITPVMAQTVSTINFNGNVSTVSSQVVEGTTYLGVRELGTATGLAVDYKKETKEVIIESEEDLMVISLINEIGTLNGKSMGKLPILSESGKTYLPLRIICDSFGFNVDYKAGTVNISETEEVKEEEDVEVTVDAYIFKVGEDTFTRVMSDETVEVWDTTDGVTIYLANNQIMVPLEYAELVTGVKFRVSDSLLVAEDQADFTYTGITSDYLHIEKMYDGGMLNSTDIYLGTRIESKNGMIFVPFENFVKAFGCEVLREGNTLKVLNPK